MNDTARSVSALLHEAGETHHQVFRIVDGVDEDWASWYAAWLVNLSELPQLLGARPSEASSCTCWFTSTGNTARRNRRSAGKTTTHRRRSITSPPNLGPAATLLATHDRRRDRFARPAPDPTARYSPRQTRIRGGTMLVSVFVRRLGEDTTYEDFQAGVAPEDRVRCSDQGPRRHRGQRTNTRRDAAIRGLVEPAQLGGVTPAPAHGARRHQWRAGVPSSPAGTAPRRRSTTRAAVQENSRAPKPRPVTGEKYS